MSSLEIRTSPTNASSTSTPDHPTSVPRSEKSDAQDHNADGLDGTANGELLLSAAKDVRQIIRLVQCGICSRILHSPATLPCGRSLCKTCIPETHLRMNISWPATANRLQGFVCPFVDCGMEHAIGDCSVDVTLNKVLEIFKATIESGRTAQQSSRFSTQITVQDSWEVAGVSRLGEKDNASHVLRGGRILSTYTLVESGQLAYGCEVIYATIDSPDDEVTRIDETAFLQLKEFVRTEMDCQICYALYLDPFTTTCGHTFCRHCLHRVLGSSEQCPVCRRFLLIQPQINPSSAPSNDRLIQITKGFWADQIAMRQEHVRTEHQADLAGEFDIPLFIVALAFPAMPTFLHVFEPRYRLMIRRAMEADRMFGMVLGTRPSVPGGPPFYAVGTLLRIVNIEFFPDGRSLLETIGVSRFRVTRHGILDGYVVGQVEKVDDVSLAEEEALEISETMSGQGVQDFTTGSERGVTAPTVMPAGQTESQILAVEDLQTKSTRELVDIGVAFVTRMRAQSVSWLTARVLAVFGECPSDPTYFPWWLASVLPVSDDEKCLLLATTSVRERMKICCRWIVEWESSR